MYSKCFARITKFMLCVFKYENKQWYNTPIYFCILESVYNSKISTCPVTCQKLFGIYILDPKRLVNSCHLYSDRQGLILLSLTWGLNLYDSVDLSDQQEEENLAFEHLVQIAFHYFFNIMIGVKSWSPYPVFIPWFLSQKSPWLKWKFCLGKYLT